MIDSHCHLTYEPLATDLEGVLARAMQVGITGCITIGTTIDDSRRAVAVADRFENVACTVGVHPGHAHEAPADVAPALADVVNAAKVVAVGETGLDYFHSMEHVDRQRAVFIEQLRLAQRVGKPVVIHSREAVDDTLAIMGGFPDVRAVFHCFTGTADEARRILDRGYYLGFTGPVTYKKGDALREVVKLVPDDRLLVETDAPYLSPEPVRHKRPCEPAYTMHTARKVAEVRGTSVEAIDRVTTENCQVLFGWSA